MITILKLSEELHNCSIVELDTMKNYLEKWKAEILPIKESQAKNILRKLLSLLIQNLGTRIQELKKKK